MALRPPQHSVDAPIVYVHHADAWDLDRIDSESKAMEAAGEDPERHPVRMYHAGRSRYDLNAQYGVCGDMRSASQYLDESQGPWRWKLKRLGYDDYYRVQGLLATNFNGGATLACRLGVVGVEGPGAPALHPTGSGLSPKDVQALFDCPHPVTGAKGWLPPDLGVAVLHASAPLSEEEGKP